jgi:hypothetical protein
MISNIGSRRGTTCYFMEKDIIICGCWISNIADFEKKVKEQHKDNPKFKAEYLGAIKFFKDMAKVYKKTLAKKERGL